MPVWVRSASRQRHTPDVEVLHHRGQQRDTEGVEPAHLDDVVCGHGTKAGWMVRAPCPTFHHEVWVCTPPKCSSSRTVLFCTSRATARAHLSSMSLPARHTTHAQRRRAATQQPGSHTERGAMSDEQAHMVHGEGTPLRLSNLSRSRFDRRASNRPNTPLAPRKWSGEVDGHGCRRQAGVVKRNPNTGTPRFFFFVVPRDDFSPSHRGTMGTHLTGPPRWA